MESNKNNRTKWCAVVKLTTLTVYAGLILFCVPVLCNIDSSQPLIYDYIYNSTNYAQLDHSIKLDPKFYSKNNNSHRTDPKENDEFNRNKYENKKDGLLVGFAHDPFRYSIPAADYMRGVRAINQSQYSNKERGKRGVLHLYNMLTCATGCDPISYKGYGCYCGFLGSGRPTDGIDNCCRLHDECYDDVYCPVNSVYLQPYYWKCFNREPHCALENYHTRNQVINGCAARLCECDRRFAMCVRRYSCPRGKSFCRSDPLRLIQNILMFK
ncbi:unnamed protein product, partial [Brenthis ino]